MQDGVPGGMGGRCPFHGGLTEGQAHVFNLLSAAWRLEGVNPADLDARKEQRGMRGVGKSLQKVLSLFLNKYLLLYSFSVF